MENRIRMELLNALSVPPFELKSWLIDHLENFALDDDSEQDIIVVRVYTYVSTYSNLPKGFLDRVFKEIMEDNDFGHLVDNVRVADDVNFDWAEETNRTKQLVSQYVEILETENTENYELGYQIQFGLDEATLVKAPSLLASLKEDLYKEKGEIAKSDLLKILKFIRDSEYQSDNNKINFTLRVLSTSYANIFRDSNSNFREELDFEFALFVACYMDQVPKVVITAAMAAVLFEKTNSKVTIESFLSHYSGFLTEGSYDKFWTEQSRILSEFQATNLSQFQSDLVH